MTAESQDRVLFVEDDKKLSHILALHFHASGYEVAVADDGVDGVMLACSFRPDVIVMDVNLPHMSGIEATRHLKQDARTSRIPIIMLTASSQTEMVVKCLDAGAEEYVTKPFEVAELLARVRTVIKTATSQKNLERVNVQLTTVVADKLQKSDLLYDYVCSLNEATDVTRIHDLIVTAVHKVTHGSPVLLMLRQGSDEYLRCVRAIGVEAESVEPIHVDSIEGMAARVLASGKTFMSRDRAALADPQAPGPSDGGMFLSIPLLCPSSDYQGEIIGILNVVADVTQGQNEGTTFGPNEIACIRLAAHAGAVGLARLKHHQYLRQLVQSLLHTLGNVAECRRPGTEGHLRRLGDYVRILASELAKRDEFQGIVTPLFVEDICQAAAVHDIGKAGFAGEIPAKQGTFTREQSDAMKAHPEIGRRILKQLTPNIETSPLLQVCIDVAYCHHEWYDGSGYPRGISGEDIPLAARIIALADAYDEMARAEGDLQPASHESAAEFIRSGAGRQFDPVIVEVFLRCSTEFNAVHQAQSAIEEETSPVEAGVL